MTLTKASGERAEQTIESKQQEFGQTNQGIWSKIKQINQAVMMIQVREALITGDFDCHFDGLWRRYLEQCVIS